jgi:PAS domain S-box-containing protein
MQSGDAERLELLERILDVIPSLVSYIGADRRYLYVNRGYEERFERPREHIIGHSMTEVAGEETIQRIGGYLDRAFAGEEVSYGDDSRDLLGRRWFTWATRIPDFDDDGRLRGIITVIHDITSYREAEEALSGRDALLDHVERVARLGYWVHRDEDLATWWPMSPAPATTLSRELRNVLSLTEDVEGPRATIPDLDQDRRAVALREAMDARSAYRVDYRLIDDKGVALRYLHEEGEPSRDPETGEPIWLGIIQDITELRSTEDQLRQAQKMEAVGQLTGGVAHDFNNILSVILGNLDLASDALAGHAVMPEIERAIAAAERGATLTRRLLAFSRRQPLNPTRLDVRALLLGMADMLRRMLGETVQVSITAPKDLQPCVADAGQLENAMLNLAINARDAMPTGGNLTITAENRDLERGPEAKAMEIRPGRYVHIEVRDDGVGMTPDLLERAIEPFFTTKEVGEGSGLGLSMVYGFAKQSGGAVRIDSAPGQGTVVSLYLAGDEGEERYEDAPRREEDLPRARGETVLVVEDNPELRALTTKMLGELGYAVLSGSDAAAAIRLLDAEPSIRLLLTDIVLSGEKSGLDLAREATTDGADLAVLYMSGYADRSHQALLEDGHLLQKPFRKADLARIVRRTLDERS